MCSPPQVLGMEVAILCLPGPSVNPFLRPELLFKRSRHLVAAPGLACVVTLLWLQRRAQARYSRRGISWLDHSLSGTEDNDSGVLHDPEFFVQSPPADDDQV